MQACVHSARGANMFYSLENPAQASAHHSYLRGTRVSQVTWALILLLMYIKALSCSHTNWTTECKMNALPRKLALV